MGSRNIYPYLKYFAIFRSSLSLRLFKILIFTLYLENLCKKLHSVSSNVQAKKSSIFHTIMKNVSPQAKILNKLSLCDRDHLIDSIIHHYHDHGWVVVHFIYFASLLNILKENDERMKNSIGYSQALISADFLLPDGIALALYYEHYLRQSPIKWFEILSFMTHFSHLALPNHNGTDFIPALLDAIEER